MLVPSWNGLRAEKENSLHVLKVQSLEVIHILIWTDIFDVWSNFCQNNQYWLKKLAFFNQNKIICSGYLGKKLSLFVSLKKKYVIVLVLTMFEFLDKSWTSHQKTLFKSVILAPVTRPLEHIVFFLPSSLYKIWQRLGFRTYIWECKNLSYLFFIGPIFANDIDIKDLFCQMILI